MAESNTQANWRIEQDADGVVWLCFDKAGASANVLSSPVMYELSDKLKQIAHMKPAGLVIWSAKKSGFIAGADIKEIKDLRTHDEAFRVTRGGQQIVEQIEKLPCASVALINGFCLGGGLELSLACTYRVGVDDDKLALGLPEVKIGVHPGFGGTVRSVRLCGVLPAMSFMLSGRNVRGKEALKIGLIDKLVKEDMARPTAARLVLKGSPTRQPPFLQKLLGFSLFRPLIAGILVKQVKAAKVRRDHYPAPYAVIDLWKEYGASEAQYEAEAHSFAKMMELDVSHNLMRVFLLQDR